MKKIQVMLLFQSDTILVFSVMGILLVLLIPFPPIILDFLLCLNISISILLVLITLNIHEPLEFSTFPAVLLLTTLFRLALNVASTRLILLKGHAGSIIQSFGNFVVGGDVLVGLVIFLILIVIQFVVITKGANRISEVTARFTLDAMPGKQMSIDADLNSGAITEEMAQIRRKKVTQEAEFYGTMDGAGKFVRGDAIAGIIIIAINIFGGFVLGIKRGISPEEALKLYIILTVGDGLVSQIPALLIALATGILTTKTSSESHLAEEMKLQFFRHTKTLGMTSVILFAFGLMPGLPTLPFWGIAVCMGFLYYGLKKKEKIGKEIQKDGEEKAKKQEKEEAKEEDWLSLDRICIELGYKLIDLADQNRKPTLMERVVLLREQIARDLGMLIPPIHIVDNIQISPHNYAILLEGERIAQSTLYPEHYLVLEGAPQPGGKSALSGIIGIDTREPAFGLPAKWVDNEQKEQAEMIGLTVINEISVMITHLSEVLKKNAAKILSRDDVHFLIEQIKKNTPKMVEGIVPEIFSITELHQILQNLLSEKVSIRNLPRILQTLSFYASKTKDINNLTEMVRQNLAASICSRYQGSSGILPVITLSPDTEYKLRQAIFPDSSKTSVSLPPDFLQRIITGIVDIKEKAVSVDGDPVLLVNMDIRKGIRELIFHTLPDMAVLSFQEVLSCPEVKCIGIVQVKD
ncbi:MAG: flagellar biosynthesis protein FlhA [Candidatus Brocadiae bacterium]|nr:flagellar biosynthesis protein FlhA [Candidatus Brocadiia bacterium]